MIAITLMLASFKVTKHFYRGPEKKKKILGYIGLIHKKKKLDMNVKWNTNMQMTFSSNNQGGRTYTKINNKLCRDSCFPGGGGWEMVRPRIGSPEMLILVLNLLGWGIAAKLYSPIDLVKQFK